MHTEIGTIKSIADKPMLHTTKKVIELADGKERSWVDCVSKNMLKKIETLDVGDVVEVLVFNAGSIGKKTGIAWNNKIAKHIKKL